MQVYKAPIDDIRFCLETFGYDRVQKLEGHADYDLETVMAMVEQGDVFAREKMLPLNRVGDEVGLKFDPKTGDVTLPDGFDELYKMYCEQGYPMLTHPVEHGGAGAPHVGSVIFNELFVGTNKSFSMCVGLSHGLIESLTHHGDADLQEKFVPKLVSGEWTGTMCLTEPQCGTDLGLMTTKAIPQDDGSYKLTGTKIWITFGEHNLTENIIHLVLARLPDAPEGIKGVSVFVVPKINLDGTRNSITCGGLEHKMGIHASPTCVMNLEDATGYMIGEPHKGMRAMFTMMNAARLFVGIEGVALGEISYQTALAFAKDRRQGRSLDREKREKDAKADNIMVHPDVRRMLLNVKSTTEGMRALGIYVACQLDIGLKSEDEKEKGIANDLVALLTPVVKSYCTERGFLNISEAMQVLGGAGYTTDWSIEQYLRDERIALLYEGTNHIQALDLVGRKLPTDGGRLYRRFAKDVTLFLDEAEKTEGFSEFHAHIKKALDTLNELTMELGAKGMADQEEAAAAASNYLNVFGLTTLAYMWGRLVNAALQRDDKFGETKVKTGRYFFEHVMPEMDSYVAKVRAGKAAMMALDVDEF